MHHTKDKGDVGVGFVLSRLMAVGVKVAIPLCEHLPFDLIAIGASGQLKRVSVKFRSVIKGAITFVLRSSWADRHGTHVRNHSKADYDVLAIYCPDTGQCYFINVNEVKNATVYFRVPADVYADPFRIFAPVAQLPARKSSKL